MAECLPGMRKALSEFLTPKQKKKKNHPCGKENKTLVQHYCSSKLVVPESCLPCLPVARAQTPALPREGGVQVESVARFAVLYSMLSMLHRVLGSAPWCRHHRGPHALPGTGGCDIAHHLPMACCKGGVCLEQERSEARDLEQRNMA